MINKYNLQLKETSLDKNHLLYPLEVVLTRSSDSYQETYKSRASYHQTNDFVNKLRPLLEPYYLFKGIQYWQFMLSYLWPEFFSLIEIINILEKIIKNHDIDHINIFQTNDNYNNMWINICLIFFKDKKIDFKVIRESNFKKLWKRTRDTIYKSRIFFKDIIYYYFYLNVGIPVSSCQISSGSILFVSLMARLTFQEGKFKDLLLKGIEEYFVGRGHNTWYLPAPHYETELRYKITKELHRQKDNFIDFQAIYRKKVLAVKDWLKIYKAYKKFIGTRATINYKGINISNIISLILRKSFLQILPQCMKYIIASEYILEKLNPAVCILTYETGPIQRAFLIAGKRKGIPTVGLQHGMIFSNHYDYVHEKIVTNINPEGFIIPDKLCVFGDYWRQILTEKGHYPKEHIAITGNWMIENFAQSKGDKKLIAVLTNGIKTQHFIKRINSYLASLPYEVIFKFHPSEEREIKEYLTNANIFLKIFEGKLENLLEEASVVIGGFSTALIDALSGNVPTILADFYNQEGWEDFKQIPGISHVTNENQLKDALNNLLNIASDEIENFNPDIFYKYKGKKALKEVYEVAIKLRRDNGH